MSVGALRTGLGAPRRLARHPEWWIYAIALGGWLAMAPHWVGASTLLHGAEHRAHAVGSPFVQLASWLWMVCAMMVPFTGPAIRHVALRSYRRRWNRARALFLLGFLLPWSALGLAFAVLDSLIESRVTLAATPLFTLGALWSLTPHYARLSERCSATRPLSAVGPEADRDTCAYGVFIGGTCVATCALPMLGCAATGHAALAMTGCFALALATRLRFRPPRRLIAFGQALLALAFAAPWLAALTV
jgi:hypothetical protein